MSLEVAGELTLEGLQDSWASQEVFRAQFKRTDQSGNSFTNLAYVFITGLSEQGAYDGMDVFSVSFQGTGAILKILEFDYTWISIETGFNSPDLIDKTIVEVKRGDTFYHVTTDPGLPTGHDVRYTTASGDFTFPDAAPVGTLAIVMYY